MIINDFLSEEDCKTLINFLDPLATPTPRNAIDVALGYRNSSLASTAGISAPIHESLNYNKSPAEIDLLTKVFLDVKQKFEEVFGTEVAMTQGMYQVMHVGGLNDLHSDTTDLDGNPLQPDGIPEEMEWSGLLYLNTCGVDYVGGEIVFPKQELSLAAKTGALVLFPGDVEHVHSVNVVTEGDRKNFVFFYGRPENIGSDKSFFDVENFAPDSLKSEDK
jgi:predicted 2-oxoglutarate/Fe(II)-dependent dioxygenase YbiX